MEQYMFRTEKTNKKIKELFDNNIIDRLYIYQVEKDIIDKKIICK